MIRIYTNASFHDIPDTWEAVMGIIAAGLTPPAEPATNATDLTDATPVLSDIPDDPEIERLNARILELEAELEERRRSVDLVLEALRPLGTISEEETASESSQDEKTPQKASYTVLHPYDYDYYSVREEEAAQAQSYLDKFGAGGLMQPLAIPQEALNPQQPLGAGGF